MVGFQAFRSIVSLRLPILLGAVLVLVPSSAAQQHHASGKQAAVAHASVAIGNTIGTEEIAVDDPSTRAWPVHHGQGIALRLPRGWQPMPTDVGLAGRDTFWMAAPLCAAQRSEGCTPATNAPVLNLHVSVERAENAATAPGDEAFNLPMRGGYQLRPVTIKGRAASLLLRSSGESFAPALLVLHVDEVYYHIAFERVFWDHPDHRRLLARILGTLDVDPAHAPEPYQPQVSAAPSPSGGSRAASSRGPETVTSAATAFSPAAAVAYARQYGLQETNSDSCYIYTDENGNNPTCQPIFGRVNQKRDGSHFIDCALRAGGLTTARCADVNDWTQRTFLRIPDLYAMLMGWQPQIIRQSVQARPGDVLIVSDSTGSCWGGIVVSKDAATGRVQVAAHSVNVKDDRIDIDPDSMYCGNSTVTTARREFLRLQSDVTPPTVRFVAPTPGAVRYGLRLPLEWIGDDGPNGSIAGYTIEIARDGGGWSDLIRNQPQTTLGFLPDQPCQQLAFRVTAMDQAGLSSAPATLNLQALLQGDFDGDRTVSDADLRVLESAWGMTDAQPGFDQLWDLNGDRRIDAADTLRLRLHQSDSCP